MLTKHARYVAAMPLPAFDTDDRVPPGVPLRALDSDRLVVEPTGQVLTLLPLQANRPEWFLQRLDGFNPPPVQVPTLKELVWEAVRAYPGLFRDELHARLMEANPRRRFTIDTLSGILADDVRIEMLKDGTRVEKVGHNQRCCTFRPARRTA